MAAETVALKRPGESLTMRVASAVQVPVGKYPEIEFVGDDAGARRTCAVRVPKSSAERQLGRINESLQSIVGKVATFSRDPNPVDQTKPFWGITLSDVAVPVAPPTNGHRKPAPVGVDLGGPIPGLDEPEPTPPEDAAPVENTTANMGKAKLAAIFKLQEVCFMHALKLAAHAESKGVSVTLEGVSALTAQAMIEANRRGL